MYKFTPDHDVDNYFTRLTEHPPFIHRLDHFTGFIKSKSIALVPHPHSYFLEATCAQKIWELCFSGTVRLDEGGIENTLEVKSEIPRYSTYVPQIFLVDEQERIKNFLVEERAIEQGTDLAILDVAFTLGAHDAFVRVLSSLWF